jgi:hypothetical protein
MPETNNLSAKVVGPSHGMMPTQGVASGSVSLAVRQRKLPPSRASTKSDLPVLRHTNGIRVFGLEEVERALNEEPGALQT